ncbi:DNA translocase SftA [Lentilactobacillus sunkii]|jgi:S-DNA-T family DNA segregation ATPase FtsK/SpoIIIE|uniref:DNA translocase FtsK n=1 Tax=Lentilactobacillus sunkii TaxID=481719 RepID=A0A1E7XCF0_9LACO|nr:DNA translocase FtsK [Lentilactobacillus sunkii]OFA10698.1 DNA translocase SftA [Lentilactobacillus sunkii]
MKHYDGPAFFRKKGITRVPRKKSEIKQVKPQDFDDTQDKRAKSILKRDSDNGDETPAFLKEIKNFKPQKRSKSEKRKQQIKTNYFLSQERRRHHLYDELTRRLRITYDDLIVLADEQSIEVQQKNEVINNTATSESNHRVSHSENHPQSMNQKVDDSSSHHEITTRRLPKEPRKSLTHHGLGQSLNSIINKEQASKTDLSLFHTKKPAQSSEQKTVNRVPNPDENVTNVSVRQRNTQSDSNDQRGYHFPPLSLLSRPQETESDSIDDWILHQSDILNRTFSAFKVNAQVVDWTNGPTVTQFQVKLALGVKVSRITNLTDDLKLALAAKDIRIEAPIPGKTTVGIEIPNPEPRPVVLSEIISTEHFKNSQSPLTTAIGVDLSGTPRTADIRKMPHGLIAGATGSGKSVFINSLLVSLLYKATPSDLRLLLIDPKAVELAPYDGIPHLLSPVISDPKTAAASLKWVTEEMDQRYEKLAAAGAKNIEQFNKQAADSGEYGLKMPYILVIIDELADLMMVASSEVEDYIVRITQKARAAGIHLIVATQRPSVDIVTGTIKNNIPSRIAFMVSSQVDSRTILDSAGAERLLGRGDMLYLGSGANQPVRLQGAFVNNQELDRIIDFVREQGEPKYLFTPESLKKSSSEASSQDRLMPQVLKYIANEDTISTSKLQRVFSIGYNRAANIIDHLQEKDLVSEQQGSKPRTVYYKPTPKESAPESPQDNQK